MTPRSGTIKGVSGMIRLIAQGVNPPADTLDGSEGGKSPGAGRGGPEGRMQGFCQHLYRVFSFKVSRVSVLSEGRWNKGKLPDTPLSVFSDKVSVQHRSALLFGQDATARVLIDHGTAYVGAAGCQPQKSVARPARPMALADRRVIFCNEVARVDIVGLFGNLCANVCGCDRVPGAERRAATPPRPPIVSDGQRVPLPLTTSVYEPLKKISAEKKATRLNASVTP